MTNQVDSAKFANQQHKIPLPGQVWRHYAGQEVKVEAIEYSRLAIGEGAVIIFRNKNVKSAHEIPEDSVLVVYSYANGDLWARSMADFLAIIGETTMFNRFDLMFDPRVKRGQEGFTILELAVVVVIISILAAIALPSF
jgi:prepilin-type N-terminal cleavage/methylation domain-containing protein